MSRVGSSEDMDAGSVTITREEDLYVATDETTGVASQGGTRAEALANLAEALQLHEEPLPEDVEPTTPDVPWFSE